MTVLQAPYPLFAPISDGNHQGWGIILLHPCTGLGGRKEQGARVRFLWTVLSRGVFFRMALVPCSLSSSVQPHLLLFASFAPRAGLTDVHSPLQLALIIADQQRKLARECLANGNLH